MVRDPSIVSPSLTGVFIGGGHNKHGTGSRCTLLKQCRPPSPRRRWRCDRSSYKRNSFSMSGRYSAVPSFQGLRSHAAPPITFRVCVESNHSGMGKPIISSCVSLSLGRSVTQTKQLVDVLHIPKPEHTPAPPRCPRSSSPAPRTHMPQSRAVDDTPPAHLGAISPLPADGSPPDPLTAHAPLVLGVPSSLPPAPVLPPSMAKKEFT